MLLKRQVVSRWKVVGGAEEQGLGTGGWGCGTKTCQPPAPSRTSRTLRVRMFSSGEFISPNRREAQWRHKAASTWAGAGACYGENLDFGAGV